MLLLVFLQLLMLMTKLNRCVGTSCLLCFELLLIDSVIYTQSSLIKLEAYIGWCRVECHGCSVI